MNFISVFLTKPRIRKIAFRGILFAWIIVFASLLTTLIYWSVIKSDIYKSAEETFNYEINEISIAINQRITAYQQVLRGGIGLFNASNEVSRKDWNIYINSLDLEKNYPGILGTGYAIVVHPNELKEHIKKIRSEGFPDYEVWPDSERNFYTSIIYLEPFTGRNLRAFGYDMFTEVVRRNAMTAAMDSGTTTVSGKVLLVQETDDDVQSGFLMYTPLYKAIEDPGSVEERRKTIKGFVYSPFRMNDLLKGIVGNLNLFHLKIYDGKNISDAALMYDSERDIKISNKNPLFSSVKSINLFGHNWLLNFHSLQAFENQIDDSKHIIILILGLVITFLTFTVAVALTILRSYFHKFEQILESTSQGIIGLDLNGNCSFMNKSASYMLKLNPESTLNKNLHYIVHHSYPDETKYPIEECPIQNSIKISTNIKKDDEVFWRTDGSSFPVEYSSNPILRKNEIKGAVVTFTDITDKIKIRKMIEESLVEKDILLKEVHHRVKNNMQIISSLLSLQSKNIKDEKTHEMIRESQNRIRSMALIHEKLYQTENFSKVNLGEYLKDLATHLVRTYRDNLSFIKLKTETENIYLSIDFSIHLGLLVNELIINSLKHAFPDNAKGEIVIKLYKKDQQIIVIVKDDGVGLPENFDIKTSNSLGLQIINSLVTQLNGEITIHSNQGVEFSMAFTVQ